MELTEYILIKYFYTTIYGYILQCYMKAEVYCPFKQLPFYGGCDNYFSMLIVNI